MLILTHLSRSRAHTFDDIPNKGYYIRFTGDEWASYKDALKSQGWKHARWIPSYAWHDGKEGAWWVDVFEQFDNLEEPLSCQDIRVQWVRTGDRYGYHWKKYLPETQRPQTPDFKQLLACTTREKAKSVYRVLAKKYHPDMGGEHTLFIKLQKTYEQVLTRF